MRTFLSCQQLAVVPSSSTFIFSSSSIAAKFLSLLLFLSTTTEIPKRTVDVAKKSGLKGIRSNINLTRSRAIGVSQKSILLLMKPAAVVIMVDAI